MPTPKEVKSELEGKFIDVVRSPWHKKRYKVLGYDSDTDLYPDADPVLDPQPDPDMDTDQDPHLQPDQDLYLDLSLAWSQTWA